MANRVLAGDHDTHGYGLYVSKSGVDVTAADNNYFLFDSNAAGMAQALLWKEVTLTSSSTSATITYANFGVRCYAIGTMSWCEALQDADDISCITEAASTARDTARWSAFGGKLPAGAADTGESVGFSLNNVDNEDDTGTITISYIDPVGRNKDICVQVLVFKEEV